jgi:hypothetical protein
MKQAPMYKLWDSNDTLIYEYATHGECWEHISNHAKTRNLGYYYRSNLLEDGTQWIDYGSHTHFFYLKEVKYETE